MLAVNFFVREWADAGKTRPRSLQSHCQTCQRIANRIRIGVAKRGVPYQARRRMSATEYRAHKRKKYRQEMRDPVKRKRRRDQQREIATFNRRAAGVKPRYEDGHGYRPPVGANSEGGQPKLTVDPAPFLQWLDEYCAVTGRAISALARHAGVDEGVLRKWRRGDGADLSTIDRIMIHLGMPHVTAVLYD